MIVFSENRVSLAGSNWQLSMQQRCITNPQSTTIAKSCEDILRYKNPII